MRRLGLGGLLGLGWLVLAGLAGASAPWLARWATGFSEAEQHVELRLAPAGTLAIPRDPSWDGDGSHFGRLDLDGNGAVGGAEELAGLATVERFARFALSDYDGRAGERDGRLARSEWPLDFQDLAPGFRDELLAQAAGVPGVGDVAEAARAAWERLQLGRGAGFDAWDLNHDGAVDATELLEAARPFRPFEIPDDALTLLDRDHDGQITPAEYPGAPVARPFRLGADALGRDVLTRLIYGAGVSLAVGLLATLVSVLIGTAWGTTAALAGGRVDAAMMRVVDVLYGLPFIFVAILLVMAFGRNVFNLFVALGAVQWLTMSRIVRAQVRGLLERDFVRAAITMGLPPWRIALRHLVPHTLGVVGVYAAVLVPAVIVEEAFLSFLGLGVQPPHASWGTLLTDGVGVMSTHPWLVVWPAAALCLTLASLHTLGDALERSRGLSGPRRSG